MKNVSEDDDPDVNLTFRTMANDHYNYAIRPETYIVPALFALIFVVGTIGNSTLVLIFVRHKQMRNVPNIYILNLALGDLLVIVSCVPFTSTVYTVRHKLGSIWIPSPRIGRSGYPKRF